MGLTNTFSHKSKYRVSWGICGDYENLKKYFDSKGMARNFYNLKKRDKNTWVEFVEIINSRGCDQL